MNIWREVHVPAPRFVPAPQERRTEEQWKAYYDAQLENGRMYEDYVQALLHNRYHVDLGCITSKFYQGEIGENLAGWEVKLDRVMAKTGNIYLEYMEWSYQARRWVRSGFLRSDNSNHLLIGDTDNAYLFNIERLRELRTDGWAQYNRCTDTSGALVVPRDVAMAETVATFYLGPKKEEKE